MTMLDRGKSGLTVGELLEMIRSMLLPFHGKEESAAMVFRLFEHYLKLNRTGIVSDRNKEVSRRMQVTLFKAARKLVEQMPLQYVTGEAYFCGLTLRVNRHVLIPRPETEEMVQLVSELLKEKPPRTMLDIGTGSGCIAIALKRVFADSYTVAVDISKNALRLASANALENQAVIEFIHGDILNLTELPFLPKFDLIISNPPYVRDSEKSEMKPNVINYEPHKALFVPDRVPLKFYRAIGNFAQQHLNPGGMLVFEVNEMFGGETAALLKSQGFANTGVRRDFRGKERFVIAGMADS